MSLLSHAASHTISRENLEKMETPIGTRTHVIIPHNTILNFVEEELNYQNLKIVTEKFAISKDKNNFFDVLGLENGEEDFRYSIGLRNSHSKLFAASLCFGATVFVCDNLSFHGDDSTIARKHTLNIMAELPYLVNKAVKGIKKKQELQKEKFDVYEKFEFKSSEDDSFMIATLKKDIVSTVQFPTLVKTWENPEHEEFAKMPKNGMRMFNAVTSVIAPRTHGLLHALPNKTRKLHELLDKTVGINLN